MIRPYCGEYLVSPVPVHMGLNWCSHMCWMCFANLNCNFKRRADFDSIRRVITNYAAGNVPEKNLVAQFLSRGYPILASNDSDPFSRNNRDQFRSLLEPLQDLGINISVQTRGGKGTAETLSAMAPTMVYISITSDDPDYLKKGEPGAPGFAERLELVQACKQAGHHVVVGLNPLVPAWWKDLPGFGEQLLDMGVKHVWAGFLHLSRHQTVNLPKATRERFSDWIAYAQTKVKPDEDIIKAFLDYFTSMGINVFTESYSTLGNFWDPYFDLGFPFMPTAEGFYDHLREVGGGKPIAVGINYFQKWAEVLPDVISSAWKEYLNPFGRTIRNRRENDKAYNQAQVNAYMWRVSEYPTKMRLPEDLFLLTDGEYVQTEVDELTGQELDILVYAPGMGKHIDQNQFAFPESDVTRALTINHPK